jgi:multiple sugar transport system permease protein
MKRETWISRTLKYGAATFALLVSLGPLYWLLTIALKREVDQFASPPVWLGFSPTLEHFREAFLVKPFGPYLWNSVIVAGSSTLLALLLGVPAAYSLARFRWSGNSA